MIFKCKVGISYYVTLVMWAIMTAGMVALAIFVYTWSSWLVTALAVVFAAIFVYLLLLLRGTCYEITDDNLLIKTGRHKLEIPISKILAVKQGVKSTLMQPTLSFQRIDIRYETPNGTTDIVQISPAKETEFISMLENKRTQ